MTNHGKEYNLLFKKFSREWKSLLLSTSLCMRQKNFELFPYNPRTASGLYMPEDELSYQFFKINSWDCFLHYLAW